MLLLFRGILAVNEIHRTSPSGSHVDVYTARQRHVELDAQPRIFLVF